MSDEYSFPELTPDEVRPGQVWYGPRAGEPMRVVRVDERGQVKLRRADGADNKYFIQADRLVSEWSLGSSLDADHG